MKFTTYAHTTQWKSTVTFSEEDLLRVTEELLGQHFQKAAYGFVKSERGSVTLMFPTVSPQQKAAAFQWKLYVERQPLTPFVEVQR